MALILGIDGGGTSCRAWAAEVAPGATSSPPSSFTNQNEEAAAALHVVFRGQSGAANVATTPRQLLKDHIRRATEGCPTPDAVCGCFAGLLTEDDRQRAIACLSDAFPGARYSAYPDYAAAHSASYADVALVAGTGSVVCSRIGGRFVKTGGRGYLLGDVGSAFRFGREAFLHGLLAGREPLERSAFGSDAPSLQTIAAMEAQAIAAIYRAPSPVAELAKHLESFSRDVKAGEPYAQAFLASESKALALQLADHLARFHPALGREEGRPVSVALAGGVWKSGRVFQDALERSWQDFNLGIQVCFVPFKSPPVVGALRLAWELLGA
ncbi:MAG: hypothetical protein HZC36_01915 [Armatimonadetes bacterium]|nr:hypothetical protein [Armatimonadota bacterium]